MSTRTLYSHPALLLTALLLLGAGSVPGEAQPPTVTVFAAASLGDAFRALQGAFERKHPHWKLRFNFAASSTLRVQIQQGAPADVFASADQTQLQPLVASRQAGPPRVFARNRLVLVVPAGNPGRLRSAKDLSRPGLRVLGTAANVPIGAYTRQVLQKLARLPGYPPDFAAGVERNVVSKEANVRAVLAKTELGEGDAALVYETDARSSTRVRMIPLPEAAQVIAEYPVAPVVGGGQRAGGEAFIRFLLSPEGKTTLRRFGFR